MFLSRLTFNTRSSLARRHLAQPYELHRTLLKGFPEGGVHMPRSDPEAHGVLYRVEKHPVLQSPYALVQSVREPDWSLLTAMRDDGHQPFLLTPPECRPFSPDVEAGKIYAFRLRANPTKRLSATRKRVGFYREEDQLLWLYRRLRSLDFDSKWCRERERVRLRAVIAQASRLNILHAYLNKFNFQATLC